MRKHILEYWKNSKKEYEVFTLWWYIKQKFGDLRCCGVLKWLGQIPTPPSMGSAGTRHIFIFLSVLVP